jgi:hypothetical protein
MERTTISKSFIESKRNAYDMGEDGNQSYIISTFAILNNLSESKSREILDDYLFTKFLKTNESNLSNFLHKEMRYKEDTMTGADIPQNVRPERPIDDDEDYKESFYEEDESDTSEEDSEEDYEIEDEEDDSDTSDVLPPSIIQFLKDTRLLKASDKEAKRFLLRFKDIISEVVDNEKAVSLIILLLYKAKFEPEKMSKGEIEELEDIVFNFTHDPNSDTSDEDKEIEESYYKPYYEEEGEEEDTKKKKKKKKKKDGEEDTSKSDTKKKKKKKKDDTSIGKEIGSAIKSSAIEVVKKYPITSVLLGSAALLGLGSIAITGWFILSKLSNVKFKKAKKKLVNDDLISDIQKGEIQNIKSTIEDSGLLPDPQDIDNQNNDTEIENDSDTSETQDERNTDDPSNDSEYPTSTIDPVDGDRSTRVDSDTIDSDTSEEDDFDNYMRETIENEDEIKSELVSDTKERLQDEEVRQQAIESNKAKRKYNKRNADYWSKDKTEPEKKKKPIDKKGNTKKKKPLDTKSKPSDTSKKKPIDKKGNTTGSAKKGDTKKKKPDVKQPIKKSDTSKKPIPKKGDTSKSSDTKPKPNENIDAYKKRTGKTRVPSGYVTDTKTKRITKKKESHDHYKLLF